MKDRYLQTYLEYFKVFNYSAKEEEFVSVKLQRDFPGLFLENPDGVTIKGEVELKGAPSWSIDEIREGLVQLFSSNVHNETRREKDGSLIEQETVKLPIPEVFPNFDLWVDNNKVVGPQYYNVCCVVDARIL